MEQNDKKIETTKELVPQPKVIKKKSFTQTEVFDYAKKHGLSYTEAKKKLFS